MHYENGLATQDHAGEAVAFASANALNYLLEREREAMSDTPKLADECKKLLDNGWGIVLYKNALGSYTAEARRMGTGGVGVHDDGTEIPVLDEQITDDFEPSQALYRLTEKVFGNIA